MLHIVVDARLHERRQCQVIRPCSQSLWAHEARRFVSRLSFVNVVLAVKVSHAPGHMERREGATDLHKDPLINDVMAK